MQRRLFLLVPCINVAFKADQVAYANLTAEHSGMMQGCSTLIIHWVHVDTFLKEVAYADGLVPLCCDMHNIHATAIDRVHVRTVLNEQAYEWQVAMVRGERQGCEVVMRFCRFIKPDF